MCNYVQLCHRQNMKQLNIMYLYIQSKTEQYVVTSAVKILDVC